MARKVEWDWEKHLSAEETVSLRAHMAANQALTEQLEAIEASIDENVAAQAAIVDAAMSRARKAGDKVAPFRL